MIVHISSGGTGATTYSAGSWNRSRYFKYATGTHLITEGTVNGDMD